jgi:hypothetical protein
MRLVLLFHIQNCLNDVFTSLHKWFESNKLALNLTQQISWNFVTSGKTCINLNMNDYKIIAEIETTKLLGLQIESNLN